MRYKFLRYLSDLDLLDFTRVRGRSLLKALLETGTVTVDLPVTTVVMPTWNGPLTVEPLRGEPQPAPLAIYADDQPIVTVPAQDHTDLSAILDTGLDVVVEINTQTERPTLWITLPFTDP